MGGQETGPSDPKVVDTTATTSISDKLKNLDPEAQELVKKLAAEMFTAMRAQEEMAKAKQEEDKRLAEEEERRKAKGVDTSGGGDPVVAELLKQVLERININLGD